MTGPFFESLHAAFERQYRDLAKASDQLAERIRTLGFYALASCSRFNRMSQVKESDGVPRARAMVEELIRGHEAVIRRARTLVPAAGKAEDHGTADLVIRRLAVHEKAAWMLRSLLHP